MPGNDFTDFFPPEIQNQVFPEVFQSNGQHSSAAEFTNLIPEIFQDAGVLKTATEFDRTTPEVFKYQIITTTGGTPAIKYRMRGYYVGGSTYEFWITTNPNSANPSGNPLINKVIDSIIAL